MKDCVMICLPVSGAPYILGEKIEWMSNGQPAPHFIINPARLENEHWRNADFIVKNYEYEWKILVSDNFKYCVENTSIILKENYNGLNRNDFMFRTPFMKVKKSILDEYGFEFPIHE